MRRFVLTGLLLCVLCMSGLNYGFTVNRTAQWELQKNTPALGANQFIYQNPSLPGGIFYSSNNQIFQQNSQKDERVNTPDVSAGAYLKAMAISDQFPSHYYLASSQSVFASQDRAHSWRRVYHSSADENIGVHDVIAFEGQVFVATAQGVFTTKETHKQWKKIQGINLEVFHLAASSDGVLAAGDAELYLINNHDHSVKKIFHLSGISLPEDKKSSHNPLIRDITVHADRWIFIASARGVFYYDQKNDTWEKLKSTGLPTEILTSLVTTSYPPSQPRRCPDQHAFGCLGIFAGTSEGVFAYEDGRWVSIYKGMSGQSVTDLVVDQAGQIYAGSEYGLFSLSLEEVFMSDGEAKSYQENHILDYVELQKLFVHEPSIQLVHEWVIDYADVSNSKVEAWKRKARHKSWMPSLSLGVDGDQDVTYSDSVYGSSSGTHYIAPDDKTYGRDYGWDVSMSWDLSDVIWSTDQTTIDSRAKLMVELREDLLDQVTRIYFERRRLQVELHVLAFDDGMEVVDRHMRIEELTALIDSLTGGKFTESLHRNEKQRDEKLS